MTFHDDNGAAKCDEIKSLIEDVINQAPIVPSFQDFGDLLKKIIVLRNYRSVCDIGGGRNPCFPVETIQNMGLDYHVVDASKRELELANAQYKKIQSPIEDLSGENKFDLMFSSMVFEHIRDNVKSYGRISKLLKKDGLCINFHPTLFSMPFVLNKFLPDWLAYCILWCFFPGARRGRHTKFPAYYSLCRTSRAVESRIQALGFSKVMIFPIYGHGYYQKIPFIHKTQMMFANFCRKNDIRFFSAYCFTVAIK